MSSKYSFGHIDQLQIIETGDGHQHHAGHDVAEDLRSLLTNLRQVADSDTPPEPSASLLPDGGASLQTALLPYRERADDLRLMVEDLWLREASAQSKTWLQRFVSSLPEKGAWAVLKAAVFRALGV